MAGIGAPAGVLARAFDDDPVTRWVLPDDHRRRRALRTLQAGSLRLCRRHGGVAVGHAKGGVAAAAGWLPYDRSSPSLAELARTGLILGPWRLGPAATRRSQAHEDVCARRVAVVVADLGEDPAVTGYLWTIGVEPARRRRGLGAAVLRQTLVQMRDRGMRLCVLKTEQEGSVAFYVADGFRLVDERLVHASGATCWVLVRPLVAPPAL